MKEHTFTHTPAPELDSARVVGIPPGFELVPTSALQWLHGEGEDFKPPEGTPLRPDGTPVARYWWRSEFARRCNAERAGVVSNVLCQRQGADSPAGQTPERDDHVRRESAASAATRCEPNPTPGVQSAPATPRLPVTQLNIGMHKALNAYALGDWDGGDAAKAALASAGIAIEPRSVEMDCKVCGKPAKGEVVIFDKAGTYQHYYHAECYRIKKRTPGGVPVWSARALEESKSDCDAEAVEFQHGLKSNETDTMLLAAYTPQRYCGDYPPTVNLTMVRMKGDVILTVRAPTVAGKPPGVTSSVRFPRDVWLAFAPLVEPATRKFKAADELDAML